MSGGLESGPTGEGGIDYPLLLECDRRGQVLWMSDRTRAVLGAADTLIDTIVPTARPSAGIPAPSSTVRYSWVLMTADGVLLSAQPVAPAVYGEASARELAGLHGTLLRHYFHLQEIERVLFSRVQRGRPGAGRSAIRQVERERQRLGRELHTGVGQTLAAIRLQLEIIAIALREPPLPVQECLGRISALTNDAMQQVRSLSRRLHPPEWQRLALQDALSQLWNMSGVPQRFEASLRIDPLPTEPDLEVKVLMYRALQEALSNLARHARATRIQAALAVRGESLVLTIQDNGVGFDATALFSAPPSVAPGIGLHSIREQAAALGGNLQIQSSPDGTKLEVSAPLSVSG